MRNDILVACDYNELVMHTPVLNLLVVREYLHVQIPVGFCKFPLYEMYDISSKVSREVNFYGTIERDYDHPWMDIPLSILDLHSGKHVYRLDFMNTLTSDVESLFISYIAQDDNPETSYIYMSNRGNTNSEDNEWKDGSYADDFYSTLTQNSNQVTSYDPLLFGEETSYNYCSTCTLPTCEDCPYKEE